MAKRPPERKMGAAVSALSAGLGSPGMGLGQAMYGLPADAPRISFIPVGDIAPNPAQPRRSFDPQGQEELAASIGRVGLLQPILVRTVGEGGGEGPKWLIVAGERRWRAVKALGQPTIAAVVTGRDPDEAALIENIQRQDLHPVDLARAVGRLAERHHYTQEELAAAIGKSQGEISKLMRILALPEAVLDEAATTVGITRAALYRLTLADAESQEAMWREMVAGDGGVAAERRDDEAALPTATRRPGGPAKSDAMAKAIEAFGAKMEKCTPEGLTDGHRERLRAVRGIIDSLLGEG